MSSKDRMHGILHCPKTSQYLCMTSFYHDETTIGSRLHDEAGSSPVEGSPNVSDTSFAKDLTGSQTEFQIDSVREQIRTFFGRVFANSEVEQLIKVSSPTDSFGDLQDKLQTGSVDERMYSAVLGLNKIRDANLRRMQSGVAEDIRSDMELFVSELVGCRLGNPNSATKLEFATPAAESRFYREVLFNYFEYSQFDREISTVNRNLLGMLITDSVQVMNLDSIKIVPPAHTVTEADLLKDLPGDAPIWAIDFYVHEIEKNGTKVCGGFATQNIVNIDHHAPCKEMAQQITSTDLALEYVLHNGYPDPLTRLAINHFDTDSTLAVLIASGLLPRIPFWSTIARAADHTGEPMIEASLLQALNPRAARSGDQAPLFYSAQNLARLFQGEPLSVDAQLKLDAYNERRAEATQILKEGKRCSILADGKVAFIALDKDIESSFFLDEMKKSHPDVAVIVIFAKGRSDNVPILKLRLIEENSAGYDLNDINPDFLPEGYGGRWNAGSSGRKVVSKPNRKGRCAGDLTLKEAKKIALGIGLCFRAILDGRSTHSDESDQ